MESSTVIAFRAMVMLACLIIVPLAAIFGSQFPDVVKSVLVDRIWPPGEKAAAADSFSHADAPPFSAATAPGWQSDAPPAAAPGFAPAATRPLAGTGSGIEPTSAWSTGDGTVRHALHEVPSNTPATNSPAAAAGVAPAFGGGMNAVPAAPSPSQTDRFTWMERRLRDYGATYYLLESWVNGAERYRFFCQMALANNPSHTRNFEATDTDPLRAMGRVLEQVEAWRTGRVQ